MISYPAYKIQNELWVSSIPEHWESVKMKYLFAERSEKGFPNETLLVASQSKGVVPKSVYGLRTVEPQKDLHLLKLVKVGDFVISLRSFQGGIEYAYYQGIISPAYTILYPKTGMVADYFRYLAKSRLFIELLQLCVTGIREGQNIDYEKLRNHLLPLPPHDEQIQIARYLDWQVSKINKLIEAKKKQIKLVEEERDSLINSAVTHGIDNAPLIESDTYNWMGTIPQNWRMVPSKRLFLESKEVRHPDDMPATASQKYGIILQSEFMRREGRRIVIAFQGLDDWKHVEPDNFVISLRSFQGGIERATITACVTWHYIVLLPQKDVCPSYFKWLLKSKSYIRALQSTSDFIRDGQDLRYSHFTKLDLPLIPLDEQNRIAQFIENSCRKYDEIIPKLERQIELLHELRTRLISDVVTGQVDVRGIEVPTFEYVDDNGDTDVEADITADDPTEEV